MTSRPANKADGTVNDAELAATGRAACSLVLRRILTFVFGFAWTINVCLLLAAFAWIYFFGQSRGIIELMKYQIGAADPRVGIIVRDPSRLDSGVTIGIIAAVVAGCAAVMMLVSLFAGCERFRMTRIWLVFMAVVCGWLGLAVSWPTIYWFGQQQRMKAVLPRAEEMTQVLRNGWPTVDSTLPEIGPFFGLPPWMSPRR